MCDVCELERKGELRARRALYTSRTALAITAASNASQRSDGTTPNPCR
jgi:hypothetical protein